ncbi:CDP-diacylglycerol--glycerol-3-phosphate 3-phosphatidyltransferase [hydrothermal vent metagenome]|uniref:CDP-diacylglycerol--glycerol-3-phosphate 3-phosphatidyltransferase n=1 Tax=hydrothermal vent metagenome TaxID=652676 RepID=A0A3B0VNZ7_9ZZZZ
MIPLVWFMLEEQYEYALYIAIAAGFSDVLDGYLAKRFGWEGWLGGVLDPLADKFMMLSCFLVFAVQNIIPNWLLILVLARDIIIITGATFYHFTILKVDKAKPSMLSKLNTALQILFIVILLAHYSIYQFNLLVIDVLIYLVTFFTVASGIHYVYYWGKKAVIENDKLTTEE